jgi:hypothetical protein
MSTPWGECGELGEKLCEVIDLVEGMPCCLLRQVG